MYFNNFRPVFPSTLPSFGAVPVGGGFRPAFGCGGPWGGMNNWLGYQFMGYGCHGMNNWFRPPQHRPEWSWQNQHHWQPQGHWNNGHHHHGHWNPGHAPVAGHRPPHSHGPSGAGGCHAMKDGGWETSSGGYRVGASGQIQVDVPKSVGDKYNSRVQYCIGDGQWVDLCKSKDGGSASIHAPPGSNVKIRIVTPDGHSFQAGSTNTADGRDHAKVTSTGNGVSLGFEDVTWDSSYDDIFVNIKDVPRRW